MVLAALVEAATGAAVGEVLSVVAVLVLVPQAARPTVKAKAEIDAPKRLGLMRLMRKSMIIKA
ncbi:hypothetical protein OSCI_3200019 [Kamptonema sp. PCC 6506]|nr:hypothetical protein OSCI_3200019 [Kamptonema sp. PCC 6506]